MEDDCVFDSVLQRNTLNLLSFDGKLFECNLFYV